MYLVNEKHITLFQIGQQGHQIRLLPERRPGGDACGFVGHFARDDLGQRGLAESRRPVEQNVLQRFAAFLGRGHGDLQLFADRPLPDHFIETPGP